MREQDTHEIPRAELALDDRSHDLVEADVFHLERGLYLHLFKPVIDVVLGLVGLVVAAPLLGIIALLIRVRMGSSVILKQTRMGQYNVPFTLYKFRTMDPERRSNDMLFIGSDRRLTHKSADDPRITSLGRWLRATRLDELPQLFNVVLGDLSLVGPRPELVSVIQKEYEPWQHRRHAVKPGLTGLWQVSDHGHQRLHECTAMELSYLDHVSLSTDLRIVLQTFPALLRRTGI